MRLDQAGQHVVALGIDDAVVRGVRHAADRGDAAIADRHVAVHDLELVVHRDDDGVTEKERHSELPMANR